MHLLATDTNVNVYLATPQAFKHLL